MSTSDDMTAAEQTTQPEKVDVQPQQPSTQSDADEQTTPENEQGPLRKLTDKAVSSSLAQKVSDNLPSAAKGYIEKGTEYIQPATSKAIHIVDKTIQSDEAQRLASSSVDFFHAVTAFTLLILTWTVSNLESTLQIEDSSTQQQQQQQTEQTTKEQSELNRHINEGIVLLNRYKVVAYTILSKASTYVHQKTSQHQTDSNQQTNTYDPYSIDKVVTKHAKKGFKLAKQVSAYSLSQASQFSGPGSSAIAPAADYIISKLPEDAKKVVQDSSSPFE